jgi:quercetin 2,3-dioxygenase
MKLSRRTALAGLAAGTAGVALATRDRNAGPATTSEVNRKEPHPMITIRPSNARGHANHGWLDSHHTFSFADYYDPEHMGFRALRVINEDRVEAGAGFGTHGHRDMEIITYPLAGAIGHRDSTGGNSILRAGEVQRMTAGTGVMHSEMNAENSELHFLQIWILPEQKGLKPGYEQKAFSTEERQGKWRVIVSHDAREGSLAVHQDLSLYATLLSKGQKAEQVLAPGRHAWVQVARGTATLNGKTLKAGDGAAVMGEERLVLEASEPVEALLFDLA